MDIADYVKNNLIDWPNWLNGLLLRLNCFGRLVYGMKYYSIKNNMKGVGNENLLLKTVNNAIAHVPYYRKLYGNIEIHSIEEFHNKISFIDKDVPGWSSCSGSGSGARVSGAAAPDDAVSMASVPADDASGTISGFLRFLSPTITPSMNPTSIATTRPPALSSRGNSF